MSKSNDTVQIFSIWDWMHVRVCRLRLSVSDLIIIIIFIKTDFDEMVTNAEYGTLVLLVAH